MASNRARAWSFIGYPGDSLPAHYASILSDEMHLCWCESPVHDSDLNGDGSEKKKHIHFLLTFEGMKSFDQIVEITDRLHCPIPQVCRNIRSLVRYFIHLDNPDKAQYKVEDIKCHGGFEVEEYFRKSNSQYRDVLKEILSFCVDNNISEFCELVELVFALGNDEWIDIITNRNTVFLSQYLKSKHFKVKQDPEAFNQYIDRCIKSREEQMKAGDIHD